MTAQELQKKLAENVHSTHTLTELREHISAIRSILFRNTDKKLLAYLDSSLPEKFNFLTTLLNAASTPEQREQLLDLAEKSIRSFETVFITLPYSPTGSQLAEYKKILSSYITKPFVIKIEYQPENIGQLTWDYAGQRHSASVFSANKTTESTTT